MAPDLPNKLPASVITSDQGWAHILEIDDSSADALNVLEKEKMKDIIDILHLEDPCILSVLRASCWSPTQSDDLQVPENPTKQITKVFSQYQGFALVSVGYIQVNEKRFEVVPKTYAQGMASTDAKQ